MFEMFSQQMHALKKGIFLELNTLHKDIEDLKMASSRKSRKRVCH